MSGQQWPGQAVTPQRAPQPVITLPNVDQAADNARADRGQANSDITTGISVQSNARDVAKSRIDNPQALRKEFDMLPEVKSYKVAAQQLSQALSTGDGPQGDLALTYAFAKAMDPDSVVRESEQAGVAGSQAWLDSAAESVKKQFGMDGAGSYTPQARAALRQQIIRAVAARNKQYAQRRADFSELAKRNGIDPFEVVGSHAGQVYLDQFRQYDQQRRDAGATVAPVTGAPQISMSGGLPTGTEIQFNMDKVDQPFDRAKYLQDTLGITPDQETLLQGFWGQNSGNPNLTPDAVKAFYAQNKIPVPDDASIAAMMDTARKMQPGSRWGPIDTSKAEADYRAKLQGNLDAQGFDPTSLKAYGDRPVQGAFMGLSDELHGIGGALDAAFSDQGIASGYREARDTARLAQEQERQQQGWTGTALELGGGLAPALLTGGGSAPASIGSAARTGAAMGAVAGYGYGEGLGGSLAGAGLGAVAGGALGAGGQKVADALASRAAAKAAQPLTAGGEVISAAERLNQQAGTALSPLPADVGGAGIRNATGGAGKMPFGAAIVGRARDKLVSEAEKARNFIANLAGNPAATRDAAGETALEGAKKYIATSKTKVDALYAKARKLGGDQAVDLTNARNVLDQQIAELAQTPGGAPGLEALKALRAELDSPFPVEGVKRMRTTLRDRFMGDGLRSTDLERRVGQVVDAADDDILQALQGAGKQEAANAYRAAADAHKERIGVIDSVLEPIIGKNGDKSPEQVMTAIESASKTNGAKLGQFLSSMPAEDAQTLRASIISRLGVANKGAQNDLGDKFSLETFLTHWNELSPSAKGQLFGGELRAPLEDLAKIASARKDASRYINFSNTGSPVGLLASGGALVSGLTHPAAWALLALDGMTGRLLASPSFARWLAKFPADKPALIVKHAEGLSKIAAADGVIAADALGLQRQLMARFATGPDRLAAEPDVGSSRKGTGKQ